MLCIINDNTEPYFNIAAEEYLLKQSSEDIFMLYRNEPSIIVGKHQNTFAEINYRFVTKNNIKVVRRLSGGGTVFHDLGNVNFLFIRNGEEGHLVDFKRFVKPIIDALNDLGVQAEQNGRNDIVVNDLKISGNAEHVYKTRTLHHGTLLYSSNLESLCEGLHVNPDQFKSKAVKSVRSKVTNISEYMTTRLPVTDFVTEVREHVLYEFPDVEYYSFTAEDKEKINRLVSEKYSAWDWNFGYSPKFTFSKSGFVGNKPVDVELIIEKGVICEVSIFSDQDDLGFIRNILQGTMYREKDISEKLSGNKMLAIHLDQWIDILV